MMSFSEKMSHFKDFLGKVKASVVAYEMIDLKQITCCSIVPSEPEDAVRNKLNFCSNC